MNKKSLIHLRFGRLVVIKESPKKGVSIRYLCKCDCGNTKEVDSRHLIDFGTQSCGCMLNESRSANGRLHRKENREDVLVHGLFAKFRNETRKRGMHYKLNFDEYKALVLSNCYYCGDSPSNKFTYTYSGETILYNGIDRLNSKKGYIKGNVVASCWKCNAAKNKYSTYEFAVWLIKVMNNFGKSKTFVELTQEMKKNI